MPAVWNTPRNWPAPPVGWQPAPGWRPDPSWPAAPEGWQFWSEQSELHPGPSSAPTKAPSRVLWLKIGVPLALLVALILGVGGTLIVSKVRQTRRDARNAATSYLQALRSHQFDAAADQLCDADLPYKAVFVTRWQSQVQARTAIASFTVSTVSTTTANGHQSGTVLARIHRAACDHE